MTFLHAVRFVSVPNPPRFALVNRPLCSSPLNQRFHYWGTSRHLLLVPNSSLFGTCIWLGRGGWPRAELHHGLILQNASVYTISRAVRTSGQATEDPFNLQFLSSFRCKCWRLNVILLHNSSDCLTNTWWSMKTIKRDYKMRFLSIESQSDESTRDRSVLHTQIVLFRNHFVRNWRDIVYFIGVYRALCTVSTYVIHVT